MTSWKDFQTQTKFILGSLATLTVIGSLIIAYAAYRYTEKQDIERLYRDDMDRLLHTGKDKELSPAEVVNLLKDLSEQIDKKAAGDAETRKKLRDDVAAKLATLFQSGTFDFGRDNNVLFELAVSKNWTEYVSLLETKPKANLNIIYRYHIALSNLHQRDPKFVEEATLDKDGLTRTRKPKDLNDGELFRDLNNQYDAHVALLKRGLSNNPEPSNKNALPQAFCWYYSATNNQALTQSVFHYDKAIFTEELSRCEKTDTLK